MEIKEAIKKREQLEFDILSLIERYEIEVGLFVTDVVYSRMVVSRNQKPRITIVVRV